MQSVDARESKSKENGSKNQQGDMYDIAINALQYITNRRIRRGIRSLEEIIKSRSKEMLNQK